MNGVESRSNEEQRSPIILQICLRLLAMAMSIAGAVVMMTNKQTVDVYGIKLHAKYSYSIAFRFFAIGNIVACGFSIASLILILFYIHKSSKPIHFFCMFLHDLIITLLLVAALASATAIGLVGRNGNSHMGWAGICDHFDRFCDKVTVSLVLSYICLAAYVLLTILSVHKSRNL